MRRRSWAETEGTVASVLIGQTKVGPSYEVVFTYKVDEHYYGGTFTTLATSYEGQVIKVFYDPNDPEKNNFSRREGILRWVYAAFFIALGLMAIYLMTHPNLK